MAALPITIGVFTPIESSGVPGVERIVCAFDDGSDEDARRVEEDPHVAELAELCRCGHDRGDHLDETPHGCEVRRLVRDARGVELGDVCNCHGFEPARMTEAMRREWSTPCACGHTRIEHGMDSPHACDACPLCRSFTAAEPLHVRASDEDAR